MLLRAVIIILLHFLSWQAHESQPAAMLSKLLWDFLHSPNMFLSRHLLLAPQGSISLSPCYH